MAQNDLLKLVDATALEQLDSHVYRVNFDAQYCVGAVPNGGYTASCVADAARKHGTKRGQPDLVTAHFEFPDRSAVGPAIIVVEEIKTGRMLSTLHLTVWQGALLDSAPWFNPQKCRRPLLAYIIQANMSSFPAELSMPTAYRTHAELSGLAAPLPDFDKLRRDDGDDNWTISVPPADWGKGAASLRSKVMYVPRKDVFTPGVMDMWVRLDTGERFTQSTLPFVADFLPYEMDRYLVDPKLREVIAAAMKESKYSGKAATKSKSQGRSEKQPSKGQPFWMATLSLDLETKDFLPEEGVDWLHLRITSKHASGGKFDEGIEIRDQDGNIIMLAHGVYMALRFDRNTAERSKASL